MGHEPWDGKYGRVDATACTIWVELIWGFCWLPHSTKIPQLTTFKLGLEQ